MAVTITVQDLALALGETKTPEPSDSSVSGGLSVRKTLGGDDEELTSPVLPTDPAARVHPVVVAMVDRYASAAPDAISNEAAIRLASYLCATEQTSWFTSIDLSGIKTEFQANHGLAFRNCGAQALLSPWRVRNAGVIG